MSGPLGLNRLVVEAEDVRRRNGWPNAQGTDLQDGLARKHEAHRAQGPASRLGRTVVEKKFLSEFNVLRRIFAKPFWVKHIPIVVDLIAQAFADLRNYCGQKDKATDTTLLWDEREKKTACRVRNHNRIITVCGYCRDDDLRLASGAGFRFVRWQIHAHDLVTVLF